MANKQEDAVKNLFNHGGMKTHKTDDKGNVIMYDRQRDNLTSTGIKVDKDGNISKY